MKLNFAAETHSVLWFQNIRGSRPIGRATPIQSRSRPYLLALAPKLGEALNGFFLFIQIPHGHIECGRRFVRPCRSRTMQA
jgi:hypothetical protein